MDRNEYERETSVHYGKNRVKETYKCVRGLKKCNYIYIFLFYFASDSTKAVARLVSLVAANNLAVE